MWVLIVMATFGYPTDKLNTQEFYSESACMAAKEWVMSEKIKKIRDINPREVWSVTCVKK